MQRLVERAGATARARAAAIVAGAARDEAPAGLLVQADGERLTLAGRGLGHRLVADADLRGWVASIGRQP